MSDVKIAKSAYVVRTMDRQYDRICVRGGRIVVCCSLGFAQGDLVAKWSSALEAAYKLGKGSGFEADENDAARKADWYRPVYQLFGAPADWDFLGGQASPTLNYLGSVDSYDAERQTKVRRTLSWIPLLEGMDYRTNPPTDYNPSGYNPGLSNPMAWLYDYESERFSLAEELGLSVYHADADYGVLVTGAPNHKLARNHWSGAQSTNYDPQETGYDYEDLWVTLAFESDQRLMLTYELLSGSSEIASTLNIDVPDAELWYLAPNTIVGTDTNGQLLQSGVGRELRNDSSRLAAVMAGAVARYNMERIRATITLHGLWSWTPVLGQILKVIEQGGTTQQIQSPICSIEWSVGSGAQPQSTTVIRTGFAR